MILKRADVLPHALINHVDKIGQKGEKLEEYIKWLSGRIGELSRDPDYRPVLHIDTYGMLGTVFGNGNIPGMADYMQRLEKAAYPFHLRI